MSGSADHASAPTPAGTRGPGDKPASMGMPNIDERDLDCEVDDGERTTGTDETRSGARHHEGRGRDDEGGPRNVSIAAGSTGMK